jgi:hypothetical protein
MFFGFCNGKGAALGADNEISAIGILHLDFGVLDRAKNHVADERAGPFFAEGMRQEVGIEIEAASGLEGENPISRANIFYRGGAVYDSVIRRGVGGALAIDQLVNQLAVPLSEDVVAEQVGR